MKNVLKYMVMTLTLLLCSLQGISKDMPQDTLYFYTSWEQMLYLEPEAYIVNPFLTAVSNYEVYLETGDENINAMINDKYMAISLGDSIWMINSAYLRKNFKGESGRFSGFAPVFFNNKVAYVIGEGSVSVKDVLFGINDDDPDSVPISYYNLDFVNHKMRKVNHSYLSELLEDYHDLQMRYEGMKDYKKQYIIEDYFFKYIDRATGDVMHPYILELVD